MTSNEQLVIHSPALVPPRSAFLGYLAFAVVFNSLNTLVFGLLFVTELKRVDPHSSTHFSSANTVTTLLSALALPLMGSVADKAKLSRSSMIVCSILGIGTTAALVPYFLSEMARREVWIAQWLYVLAIFFLRVAVMNNNSLLGVFAPASRTSLSLLSNLVGFGVNLGGLLLLEYQGNVLGPRAWWMLTICTVATVAWVVTVLAPSDKPTGFKSVPITVLAVDSVKQMFWTLKCLLLDRAYRASAVFLLAYLFFSIPGTGCTIFLTVFFGDVYNAGDARLTEINLYYKISMVGGVAIGMIVDRACKRKSFVAVAPQPDQEPLIPQSIPPPSLSPSLPPPFATTIIATATTASENSSLLIHNQNQKNKNGSLEYVAPNIIANGDDGDDYDDDHHHHDAKTKASHKKLSSGAPHTHLGKNSMSHSYEERELEERSVSYQSYNTRRVPPRTRPDAGDPNGSAHVGGAAENGVAVGVGVVGVAGTQVDNNNNTYLVNGNTTATNVAPAYAGVRREIALLWIHNVWFLGVLVLLVLCVKRGWGEHLALALFMGVGVGYGWNMSVARALLVNLCPSASLGQVMGLYSAATYIGISLASAASTLLAEWVAEPSRELPIVVIVLLAPSFPLLAVLGCVTKP